MSALAFKSLKRRKGRSAGFHLCDFCLNEGDTRSATHLLTIIDRKAGAYCDRHTREWHRMWEDARAGP